MRVYITCGVQLDNGQAEVFSFGHHESVAEKEVDGQIDTQGTVLECGSMLLAFIEDAKKSVGGQIEVTAKQIGDRERREGRRRG